VSGVSPSLPLLSQGRWLRAPRRSLRPARAGPCASRATPSTPSTSSRRGRQRRLTRLRRRGGAKRIASRGESARPASRSGRSGSWQSDRPLVAALATPLSRGCRTNSPRCRRLTASRRTRPELWRSSCQMHTAESPKLGQDTEPGTPQSQHRCDQITNNFRCVPPQPLIRSTPLIPATTIPATSQSATGRRRGAGDSS
jgi:hypothetical protein